jgi:hypothetical protein
VAFIESIPFSETRGYVKNVLSYDAYYRYFMGQKDTLLSDAEWSCAINRRRRATSYFAMLPESPDRSMLCFVLVSEYIRQA